jgi:murein DD-endopeptidase MepM/ murein hydrolase activator NlpD
VGQFNLQPNNTVESSSLSKFILDRTVITQQFTQINANTQTNPDDLNLISTQNKETQNDTTTNSKTVFEYTVKEGETIAQIAALYGLKEETVKFNNNLENQEIKPGTQLILPWTDAYIYKVEDEVTINYLSQLYQIDGQEILDYNHQQWSQEDKIPKSTLILIPINDLEKIKLINQQEEERKENLRKAEEERKKRAALAYYGNGNTYRGVTSDQARSEGLIWPVTGNFIISRCVQPGHIACDFADPSSPPIFAAKDGVVSAVYRFNVVGYGLAVVINHGNGLKTLYAHLSEIYVKPGEFVKQGVAIGRMGCTGWCTGTHLHFEVIYNGVRQDPLLYLS